MSVVDVSRIPNNNKFDPVREAILQLEGIIESGTAGVFSVNGEQGTLTLQAGANTSISTSNGVITISSTASTGTLDNTLTLTAGDGISLSSPSVFDGSADVNVTITNDDRPNAGILTIVAGSGISTVGAADWDDEPQTWGQQGRIWSVSEGNTFSANELSDKSITLTHGDTSSISSSSNTNGVVIQSLGIDEFGHTQSIGTIDLDDRYVELTDSRIPQWTAAYNDKINSASFNTGDGVLTLTQQDGGTVTVDLDGRYSTTTENNYVSSVTFSTSTGVLTLNREGLSALTVDLDGKYLNIGDKAADANLLDGLDSTYFLNYNNLTNKPAIPTVNNNTITLAAGGAMTGGGAFTVNQGINETITLSHADTSAQGSVNNSGRTYIQDVTLDTYGHVIGLTSATETVVNTDTQRTDEDIRDVIGAALVGGGATIVTVNDLADTITISSTDTNTTYSAGAGLTLGGTTFSHADTSAQASVNNSGTTFIQDVTLDTYGHVTGLSSASVSIPTVYDSIITISAGAAMTGGGSFGINQSFGETITINHADTSAQGSVNNSGGTVIQDISLDAYGHVTSIGSANLDGRYLAVGAKAADSDLLDGLDSSYYLDYNNLNNKPTTTVANNSTITLAGTGGLSGTFGAFTTNQSFNETIFISLPNTGVTATTYGSSTQVPVITVDTKGRITSATTVAVSGGGGGVGTLQQVTDLGNTTTNFVSIGTSSAPSFALDVSGTIRATFDVIAYSDIRVKENIEDIPDALEKILSLRGVTFNKIGEEKRSTGVIAQEVETVLPEAVHTDEEGMKSVAYGNMVGLLIQAMKEQQIQIEQLRQEVKYLKSN